MRSTLAVLRLLMADLSAGRMPPPEAIQEGRAALEEHDQARAEMDAVKSWQPSEEGYRQAILEGRIHIPLTKPQWMNLKDMVFFGAQPTYGKWRARVQNRLVKTGLAIFVDGPGSDRTCAVTDIGRKVYEANTVHGRYVPDQP